MPAADDPLRRTALQAAVALHKAGDPGAVAAYGDILARWGEAMDVLANLASLAGARGDLAQAEGFYRRALALAPDVAALWRNVGNLYRDHGRVERAADAYQEALRLAPADVQTAHDLACMRLAQGRLAEGWALYERRAERAASRAHALSFPEWQGEPLAGKQLFLWPEQGFGDQILAARFIPRLEADVTLACLPPLSRLFRGLAPRVEAMGEAVHVAPHDYWALPMSLAGRLGATLETLPTAPYLSGAARGRHGGVGVAFRGNARPDPNRSLPEALGRELLALPGAVSLHPEDTGAADFQDTADLIAALDLVISIDTSVAHLAGAMGKPTWVLLQARVPEWRWIADPAGRSLWYPSARILRQPAPGDWRAVVDRIRAEWPG